MKFSDHNYLLYFFKALTLINLVKFLSILSIDKINLKIIKDNTIIIKAKNALTESCIQVNFVQASINCGLIAIAAKIPQNINENQNSRHSIFHFTKW